MFGVYIAVYSTYYGFQHSFFFSNVMGTWITSEIEPLSCQILVDGMSKIH